MSDATMCYDLDDVDDVVRFCGVRLAQTTSRRHEHDHPDRDGVQVRYATPGERCSACRWFEVAIYRSTAGVYAVHTLGHSIVPGEIRKTRVEITDASRSFPPRVGARSCALARATQICSGHTSSAMWHNAGGDETMIGHGSLRFTVNCDTYPSLMEDVERITKQFFGGSLPVVPGAGFTPTGEKITTDVSTVTVTDQSGKTVTIQYTADVEVHW
jgi:hypothetical protein